MDVGMSDTLGFFLTVSGKAMCFFEWRGIRSKVRRNFTRSGTEEFRELSIFPTKLGPSWQTYFD
jgi:hypothetical protein